MALLRALRSDCMGTGAVIIVATCHLDPTYYNTTYSYILNDTYYDNVNGTASAEQDIRTRHVGTIHARQSLFIRNLCRGQRTTRQKNPFLDFCFSSTVAVRLSSTILQLC